jgi:hypothetical protein
VFYDTDGLAGSGLSVATGNTPPPSSVSDSSDGSTISFGGFGTEGFSSSNGGGTTVTSYWLVIDTNASTTTSGVLTLTGYPAVSGQTSGNTNFFTATADGFLAPSGPVVVPEAKNLLFGLAIAFMVVGTHFARKLKGQSWAMA